MKHCHFNEAFMRCVNKAQDIHRSISVVNILCLTGMSLERPTPPVVQLFAKSMALIDLFSMRHVYAANRDIPQEMFACDAPHPTTRISTSLTFNDTVVAGLQTVMQAGFCMLEVGSIGGKHTKNLLTKVSPAGNFSLSGKSKERT